MPKLLCGRLAPCVWALHPVCHKSEHSSDSSSNRPLHRGGNMAPCMCAHLPPLCVSAQNPVLDCGIPYVCPLFWVLLTILHAILHVTCGLHMPQCKLNFPCNPCNACSLRLEAVEVPSQFNSGTRSSASVSVLRANVKFHACRCGDDDMDSGRLVHESHRVLEPGGCYVQITSAPPNARLK